MVKQLHIHVGRAKAGRNLERLDFLAQAASSVQGGVRGLAQGTAVQVQGTAVQRGTEQLSDGGHTCGLSPQ